MSKLRSLHEIKISGENLPVRCRNCTGENVHILAVSILSGPDDYFSDAKTFTDTQTFVAESGVKTPNRNRNLSVMTSFGCEDCDADFATYMGFHKGSASVYRCDNGAVVGRFGPRDSEKSVSAH